MNLKEKIEARKLKNEIDEILDGLRIEFTEDFSYIENSSEQKIVKESQKYAKILYDVIKSAQEKNDVESFNVLKQVIKQCGKWKERSRRGASRGPGCYGIQLIIPEEIKLKLNKLHEKYLNSEKQKQQKLENDIDNIINNWTFD